MKDHCVMGMICRALAMLLFLAQIVGYGMSLAMRNEPLGWLLVQIPAALLWPAVLWSFGGLLDSRKVQERKMDRILELLGDVEESEEDLTQLEARLEDALETGEEPEWPQEEE